MSKKNSPYKVVSYYGKGTITRYYDTLRLATDNARKPAGETNTVFKKVNKTWKGVMRFSHKKLNKQLK
jgi:hypothetical protein